MKLSSVQWAVLAFWALGAGLATVFWLKEKPRPVGEMGKGFVVQTVEDLKVLPNVEWPKRDGSIEWLGNDDGRWTLVHFWATWCAPCIDEIPELVAFAESQIQSVRVIAVSLDESWDDAARIIPKDAPSNWIDVIDVANKTPAVFGSYQFPETYLIDSRRRIHAKWVGPQPWSTDDVRTWFAELTKP